MRAIGSLVGATALASILSVSISTSGLAGSENDSAMAGAAKSDHGSRWEYQGRRGPPEWGHLDGSFKACRIGKKQSPISIPDDEPPTANGVKFHYQSSALNIVNNGHTIQVNYDEGSHIIVDGKKYRLKQFHFHAPSEHLINGVPAAMEMHLVHMAQDRTLAVIGLLFDFSETDNPFLNNFWGGLPPAHSRLHIDRSINVGRFFNPAARMVRYVGSLTTPPCSEGVKWFVIKEHSRVSHAQVADFVRILGYNARPAQPVNGRLSER